ncbi:MAG: WXG100 family type VII secretion target [Anaerolineales bacterium]
MTGPKVRADYEQLKTAASQFGGQAQAAQQTVQALQKALAALEGGDWVGLGASAFYQEMGGQVMPALKRLAAAMESAQRTTTQIGQVIAQAEGDAARVLRGEGSGQAGGLGVMAGLVAAGPPNGTGTGSGGSGGGAPALAGARGNPVADAVGRMVARDQAAVDRTLSQFSPGVRAIIKQSPTLTMQIAQLEQAGFNFQSGPVDGVNFTDRSGRLISIAQSDPPSSDAETAAMIAHEAGHGVSDRPLVHKAPGMTQDEYVNANLPRMMAGEGQAQFNAAQVRREVLASGGPDIGIPGTQDAAFQQAFDDFTAGNLTHDQALARMTNLMNNETSSGDTTVKYPDFYRELLRRHWEIELDDPPVPSRP